MTDLKQYFTPTGWDIFCELHIPDSILGSLAGKIAYAATDGPLEYVYDTEMDFHGKAWDVMWALAVALDRNGKEFSYPMDGAEYLCGSYGKRYISLGIGHPLQSACCGYWIAQT